MTNYMRINDSVRTFGGGVWEVAEADISYPDGVLLVNPEDGHWMYFMNNEVTSI